MKTWLQFNLGGSYPEFKGMTKNGCIYTKKEGDIYGNEKDELGGLLDSQKVWKMLQNGVCAGWAIEPEQNKEPDIFFLLKCWIAVNNYKDAHEYLIPVDIIYK